MKNFPIEKFGTKLMASSRSINKIPYEYLKYAENLRIYDGGIGPRLGFRGIYQSDDGENRGGFSLNGSLYQVEGGKIWKMGLDGTRNEIVSIGHNKRVDVLVYQNTRGEFTVNDTQTINWDSTSNGLVNYWHNQNNNIIIGSLYSNYSSGGLNYDESITTDITGYALPAIKFLQTGTTTFVRSGSPVVVESDGIIVTEGQYVRSNGSQDSGAFDIQVGRYTTSETAIITGDGEDLKIFDGETVSTVTIDNSGIIEYTAGRSWITNSNILLASRPIDMLNPQYAYDFTGQGSYQITYESRIEGLESTLSGLYVFTENKVEYLADGQTVNGLSVPIGDGGNPVNNLCIVSAGEKIFYLTKKLQIETVNYVSGINDAQIGELSNRKLVNMRDYLQNLDENQETAFAFNNKSENTIQFFLRTVGSSFNDVCVIYDIVNDTWNIDKGRYFNYVVENNGVYYGYSDVTSSIYHDFVGFTDNGNPITTRGETQSMSYNTSKQKMFTGFDISGAISSLSSLDILVCIDEIEVFRDTISSGVEIYSGTGSTPIGDSSIGGESTEDHRTPFIREADSGRIFMCGDRIQIKWSSDNNIQDWILDSLGITLQTIQNTNTNNKF